MQELQKENERLKLEISILQKKLLFLETKNQEMLTNEITYRNLIMDFQDQLKKPEDKHEVLNEISEKYSLHIPDIHKEIHLNICNLQSKIDEILNNREETIVAIYNSKLKEINDGLEKEKKEKLEDFEKGIAKKSLLKHQLEVLRSNIGVIESKINSLETQNKDLRSQLRLKDLEITALHKKLFEIKEKAVSFPPIKVKTEQFTKSQKEIKTTSLACETDIETDPARYEKLIVKLQKLLALEKSNSKAARNAYIRELNSRNEIEDTIINCIEEVKQQRQAAKTSAFQLSYNMAIVEKLTNSKEILTKLHEFLSHKCEAQ